LLLTAAVLRVVALPRTSLAAGACQPPRASTAPDAQESLLVTLINGYRQQNGLSALAVSPALSASAEWKSADMLANSYFAHDDLNRSWSQRIADCGYGASPEIAENIAEGTQDAQATLLMWENSPPHNANLLDPQMRAIGVGRAGDPSSQYTWYWTADFGATADATASVSTPVTNAAPAAAAATSSGITIGAQVQVSGTNDCLRVHSAPSLTAPETVCLPDGFVVPIADGPQTADGHTWWKLGPLGWAVGDYLTPSP
jgi:uncharacterized protein YkwD